MKTSAFLCACPKAPSSSIAGAAGVYGVVVSREQVGDYPVRNPGCLEGAEPATFLPLADGGGSKSRQKASLLEFPCGCSSLFGDYGVAGNWTWVCGCAFARNGKLRSRKPL